MSKGKNQDLPDDGAGIPKDRTSTPGKSQPEGTNNESEKLFQAIFEQAAVGVAQIVSKTGRFVRINQRYCDIVGYSREDMEKKTFQEISHPDDLQADLDNMARLLAGEIHQFTMEKRYYRKDGSIVWVNLNVSPLWSPGDEPTTHVAVVEDITARKRAEENIHTLNAALEQRVVERTIELKKSNEQLQREIAERKQAEQDLALLSFALNHVHESAFLSDEHARFHYVNEAACRSLGYSREELLGLKVADVDPDYQLDDWPDHWRKLKACGSLMFESRHRAKDGRIFPVELSANYFVYDGRGYILGLARDITDRKISEEKLRESEERFQMAMRGANDGLWDWNLLTDEVYYSPRWKAMLGYVEHELDNHINTWKNLVCPDDLGPTLAQVRDLIEGRTDKYEVEFCMRHKDGHYLDILSRAFLVRNTQGKALRLVGTHVDISDRKRVERLIIRAKEEWERTFDASSDPIMILDTDHHIQRVNRAMAELIGASFKDAIGKICYESVHKTDAPAPTCPLSKVIEDGQAHTEEVFDAERGKHFLITISPFFDEDGSHMGSVHYMKDITARKQAEEKLRESEEKYRRLIENIEERHFIYVHDAKGEFTYISPSIEHMLGYTPQEFCTHYTRYLTDNPVNDEVVRHTNLSIQGVKQPPYHIEIYHKSGAIKWLEVAESPILNESGQVIAVQGIATDITERHLLEQEQLKTQKLEAVGTLAGGIAHDFNNLLQGVFGYLSLAKLKIDQKEKALAMLDQAEKALSMSVNLTSQLLTFSKGGKPVIKKTDIRPVIENAAKFALSGSRCDYRLSIAGDLWHAEVDEGQIAQVIQNIVLNASDAMPDGGTVEISADNRELSKGDMPSLPDGGRFVVIRISDTGIGIPERYLERIFDPYFTTKQKGSGLGLATSYSIIRNHGGVIEAAAEPNRGSTFVIYLPASETEGKMEPQTTVSASGRKGRILIMDDEEMVRDVAGVMVEAIGHEVESAAGGEEAIEMFRRARESGRPFDVLILDLTVKGGMGGEEAIRKIREIAPDVIAVVSSGYADNPVLSDFRAYGFAAVLNKPYSADALRDCLNTLIA